MFFNKKLNLKHQQPSSTDPEQVSVVNADNAEEDQAPATNTNSLGVFGKMFFRSQKYSGPDTSYENEAWAPEIESVGLFRKHRSTVEE